MGRLAWYSILPYPRENHRTDLERDRHLKFLTSVREWEAVRDGTVATNVALPILRLKVNYINIAGSTLNNFAIGMGQE